ncbi:Methyltransferase type 11 [Magnetococcus marinus MC-1]|uniref:Methyltransferase type 11 n=1 Tax=Magnetococcus marinus (strain ATCC BAA-1437 / JCM 17883 / MC-1) TaxID=156889 RepID=A0L6Q8_MAGMM|nr:class I SAM-dependent methyltransferase [Magnetococcus marinus]ABK43651.1 Methyltransferase type 11 [Magnetococcus marinus MC-1]
MDNLKELYQYRFSPQQLKVNEGLWATLCESFFQRFVKPTDVVLDLACGYGHFSRNIKAGKKYAVDLNADAAHYLPPEIQFIHTGATALHEIPDDSLDVVFTSNFFEHLPDKAAMDKVLQEVWRVLRVDGTFMALQPNLRYSGPRYWDYFDHQLPLTHLSCAEGFAKNGFRVTTLYPRFLPWSTQTRLPKFHWIIRLYLHLPWIWPLIGKQFFILGTKKQGDR